MSEIWKRVQVPAQADSLQRLRTVVREYAQRAGFSPDVVNDLVLAVNEACMNVIQHGYRGMEGNLELRVSAISGGIEFRIRDFAPSVSLTDWRPRALEELRPGGLGVHFIRAIMDEVAYLPPQDHTGNLLSMKKYLDSRGEGA